jgi:lipopolysaccharide/colanic/teichoic acid biosynthesis glycosyltransferase
MDELSVHRDLLRLASRAPQNPQQNLLPVEFVWIESGYWSRLIKRGIDIAGSLSLLLLLSPLLAVVACAVARSGRPILFAQARVGLGGRIFRCLKFRSMSPGAEEILDELLRKDSALRQDWERGQKLKNDFRITPVGAILRKWSLDELPQLWNVLRGDMSLVGPRPALPSQMEIYGASAAVYSSMRPGITGLWQITARGDMNFKRRVALDCEYVENFTLGKDLVYLLKTVLVVLRRDGAH